MTAANLQHFQSTASSSPMNTIGVYRVSCLVNGMCYVGWSKRVNNRLRDHLSLLRSRRHNRREMQADFDRHGEESFRLEVIRNFDTEEEAMRKEAALIAEAFKTGTSYNAVMPVTITTPAEQEERSRRRTQLKSLFRDAREIAEERNRLVGLIGKCRRLLAYKDDETFLALVECFLELSGESPTSFGKELMGDAHFVFEIRRAGGRSTTLRTAKKAHDFILAFVDDLDARTHSSKEAAA